jgi:ECF sigma factor
MSDVTHIRSAIEEGDPHAAERLLPLVYDELRKLAAQKLAHEKPGRIRQQIGNSTAPATALLLQCERRKWLRITGFARVLPRLAEGIVRAWSLGHWRAESEYDVTRDPSRHLGRAGCRCLGWLSPRPGDRDGGGRWGFGCWGVGLRRSARIDVAHVNM